MAFTMPGVDALISKLRMVNKKVISPNKNK